MARRQYTSVCAKAPDGLRTLFRLFELKDGSLCIEIVAGDVRRNGGKNIEGTEIEYQKFSVHPSAQDPRFCKVTFSQLGLNSALSHHQSVEGLKGPETFHIVSKRFPALIGRKYDVRSKGSVKLAIDFEPKFECLMAHIFVRRSDSERKEFWGGDFQVWEFSGSVFSVCVVFKRIAFGALSSGYIVRDYFDVKGVERSAEYDLLPKVTAGSRSIPPERALVMADQKLTEEYFRTFSEKTRNPTRVFELFSKIYAATGPARGALFPYRALLVTREVAELNKFLTAAGAISPD